MHANDNLARRFLFEFVVVVAGVLVALAVNAWYQGRQDDRSEAGYLALLARDLERTVAELEVYVSFESRQLDDAALARRAIATLPVTADTGALSESMARLLTRHTLVLRNAAYQDLVSTGHLGLIDDPVLRDRIVDFYQVTQLQFDVINRNNAYFVDQAYNSNVIMSGLIQHRLISNQPSMAEISTEAMKRLGPGFSVSGDRLWSLPADAAEWDVVRSTLLARMLVSEAGFQRGTERLRAARELKAAVDSARDD